MVVFEYAYIRLHFKSVKQDLTSSGSILLLICVFNPALILVFLASNFFLLLKRSYALSSLCVHAYFHGKYTCNSTGGPFVR